jgi:hypothetical protein
MNKTTNGIIILCTIIMVDLLIYIKKPLGEDFYIIADLLVVLLSLTAFCFGIYAYKLHGSKNIQGKAILFLSLGILFWFFGESIWAFYEIIIKADAPIASLADAFWLLGYPLFAAGLYYEWKITRAGLTRNKLIAGSFIFIITLLISGWYGIIVPLGNAETSQFEKIVLVSYVIGDIVVMLGAIIVLTSLWGGKLAKQWTIITVAIILTSVADIIYAYMSNSYQTGNWIDILWDANYLLLAYGFYHYRQTIICALQETNSRGARR